MLDKRKTNPSTGSSKTQRKELSLTEILTSTGSNALVTSIHTDSNQLFRLTPKVSKAGKMPSSQAGSKKSAPKRK